jgi:hypothetical protein
VDSIDFVSAPEHKSTASVTLAYDGGPPPNASAITWAAASVVNPTALWWRRGPGDFNGLSWGGSPDGTSRWTANAVLGTAPTGAVARISDVVGNRTVTLRATLILNGVPFPFHVAQAFGSGPISVFGEAGAPPPVQWAINDLYNTAFGSMNPSSSAAFPGPVGYCGGTAPVASLNITLSGAVYEAAPAGDWVSGWYFDPDYQNLASASTKVATANQLLLVSRYDSGNYTNVRRKGAALAAGWDSSEYYGTNALIIANDSSIDGTISTTAVNVDDGGDTVRALATNLLFACVP